MQVFKAYGHIINKYKVGLLIYIGIFLFISIVMSSAFSTTPNLNFENTKIPIAVINRGVETDLINGFEAFLEDYAIIKPIEDDKEAIMDALFIRDIVYFIIIPEGFSLSNTMELEVMGVENSPNTFQMNMLVDKYFNMVHLFEQAGTSPDLLNQQVFDTLEHTVDVVIQASNTSAIQSYIPYFNYLPYVFLGTIILGVATVMSAFNNKNINRRILCSSTNLSSINAQLFLGNLCFGFFIWFIMISGGLILNIGNFKMDAPFLTIMLNTLILLLVCISIAFLIGHLVTSKEAQSGITNMVSLGSCFIGGVFVPQFLLGDTVNTAAMFTPIHWYIKTNNLVVDGASFLDSTEVILAMGIQLLFALTLFIIAIAVSKIKKQR